MNSNNKTNATAKPTVTVELEPVQFPTAKRFLSPDPTQSILADMRKVTDPQPSTHLRVSSVKRPDVPNRPSYSAAFALPAQSPAQPADDTDKRNRKAVPAAPKEKPSAFKAGRPPTGNEVGQKPTECSCSLIPCTHKEENVATFPQAEALSTIMAGQPVNFGEALFAVSTVVGHPVNTEAFMIQNAGIYELNYSLNYEVAAPCTLIFGFENFPQSYFKQPITYAPARGKLKASVRLLLDAGTVLRLVLVEDPAAPSIQHALVSNAMLEIRQLYHLNLICPEYNVGSPEKNFRSENSFVQKPVPNISSHV